MNTNHVRRQVCRTAIQYNVHSHEQHPGQLDNLNAALQSAAQDVRHVHQSVIDSLKRHFQEKSGEHK